ncbi:MAG: hypothetical protein E7040_08905 [Lentisphaerae bacterium]|nr:hypothetical protein [Lentisphaerota bacterium]
MNKVFLAVVVAVMGTLASLMAAPVKNVTVDHSSKEAIVDSFLKASAYEDGEALWQTFLPLKLKKQRDLQSLKKSSIENYFRGCPASARAELRKIVNTPEWKKLIDEYLKDWDKYIIKVDGKWYIDMWKMLGQEFSNVKIPPCPRFVDHSSPTRLVLSFLLSVYYENDKLMWDCFSPELRKSAEAKTGGKAPRGIARATKQSMPRNVLVPAIKVAAFGEINVEEGVLPGMKFVKINGKWYIAPAER